MRVPGAEQQQQQQHEHHAHRRRGSVLEREDTVRRDARFEVRRVIFGSIFRHDKFFVSIRSLFTCESNESISGMGDAELLCIS